MSWKKLQRQPIIIGFTVITIVFFPVMAYFVSIENDSIFEVTEYKIYNSSKFDVVVGEEITNQTYLNLGFVNEVFLSFNISEAFELNDEIILEIKNPTFREVLIYQKDDSGGLKLIDKAGTDFGMTNLFSSPNPLFTLTKNDQFEEDIYLKISSFEPIRFKISTTPLSIFHFNYNQRILFISCYIGVMFALFLYNFILFFLIRDRVYFVYSVYILFIALAQLSLLGYSFYYFLGQNSKIYEISIIGFSAVAGVAGISFMRMFLKTETFTPLIDKFLIINIIFYVTAFIFRVLNFIQLSYTLTDISGLMVTVFFLISATIIAKKGYRPAMYFLIGWMLFFIGLVVFILQNQGIIKLDLAANFPMLVGTAMEAILLSLALADRINILKKEKEDEQHEKLEILKENERLIKEQNTNLEQKVKIRTEELEETLFNLQNTQTQLVNQEKMASLGQLTAGIAHEINNPINFVSSNISPLKRDIQDLLEVVDKYRELGKSEFSVQSKKEIDSLEEDLELDYILTEIEQLLKGMEDGAKRTVEIVKGLRLFSRVDEQDVKKVDLHDGINSTLILLNSSMSGRIKIVKDYEVIPLVECLAGKINQVFMNIITNAIHALTDHLDVNPEPVITIRSRYLDDHVCIEIEDNGPGMPEHVKQRIFEPFFTTKAVGKGTGLGLSIVYTIIENHKGILEVFSSEGKGTKFSITLPIYQLTPQND